MMMRSLIGSLYVLVATAPLHAGNVDLSTIPARDTVQLTIYNSEDLTLVRETRTITFSKGVNPLQFSWANTLIDATSVELQFKSHRGDLSVVDTTYPHDRPQVLYWNVRSEFDGAAEVEITYFTSGLTWAAQYVCTSDVDEERMSFEGFVTITNNSGEEYAEAQVRLVVGEINLVEKIAELARRGLVTVEEASMWRENKRVFKNAPAPERRKLARAIRSDMDDASSRKEIVKEGLSEYFIYTIGGTETIGNGWSKTMRLLTGASIPFQVKYRYRPQEYGDQLCRMFILRNDKASKLGTTPLPDGQVRLFRDNGQDGLSFLTTYTTKYVPIGQEIELNLGRDPEVIHERVRLRSWRDDFWFRDVNGSEHFNQGEQRRVRKNFPISGWNDHESWVERIRNYRDEPVAIEIRRSYNGHVLYRTDSTVKLHDYRTPQLDVVVGGGEVHNLAYDVTYRQGLHASQDNVTLE